MVTIFFSLQSSGSFASFFHPDYPIPVPPESVPFGCHSGGTGIYRNNLKNRFLTSSGLLQNSCSHSSRPVHCVHLLLLKKISQIFFKYPQPLGNGPTPMTMRHWGPRGGLSLRTKILKPLLVKFPILQTISVYNSCGAFLLTQYSGP